LSAQTIRKKGMREEVKTFGPKKTIFSHYKRGKGKPFNNVEK